MLNAITNFFEKREYISWQTYYEKMRFMENFYWQQNVRKKSVKNLV